MKEAGTRLIWLEFYTEGSSPFIVDVLKLAPLHLATNTLDRFSMANLFEGPIPSPHERAAAFIASLPRLHIYDLRRNLDDSCPVCLVPLTMVLAEGAGYAIHCWYCTDIVRS